jgi:hypothetical protein
MQSRRIHVVKGLTAGGNQVPILVDDQGRLIIEGGGGGGGGGGAPWYSNLAALRAATVPTGAFMVYMLDVGTQDAPPGGWFRWSSASTATDDGVDVILPNDRGSGTPGRYLRTT